MIVRIDIPGLMMAVSNRSFISLTGVLMPRSDYWIKIFDSLPNHWKVRHVQEAMGWNRFETVGFLVMFWLQVASDAPTGVLDELVSANDILKAIGLKDKTKKAKKQWAKAIDAMLKARLLDIEPGDDMEANSVHVLHDWTEGAGSLEAKRHDDTQRQQRRRARSGQEELEPPPERHADVTNTVSGA